jgi:protein-S-isoprenylcysteine O-methyltransferase Ste14/uncharacterized membrane protein (UPF0127 family)
MIRNLNNHAEMRLDVLNARSLSSRVVGLLGTASPLFGKALLFEHCRSIHTFGMKYPIDVIFLDPEGCIVHIIRRLKPNAIPRSSRLASSVLELCPGTADRCGFRVEQYLQLEDVHEYKPDAKSCRGLFHWPINVIISLFWLRFVLTVGSRVIADPHILDVGILIHNTLLMVLFLLRRKSSDTSHRFRDWIVPILTLSLTMFLRPAEGAFQNYESLSFMLQAAGLSGIILSLLSLGRSFGIVPANRHVVSHGTYRFIRHPLYVSEIIFHIGFFAGNITAQNGILIALILAGQWWRSLAEERLLTLDEAYREYKQRVRYRFIPGVY